MVAAADVGKNRQLSGAQEYFCRLIAYDGKLPTAAYRIVWKAKSAHDLGPKMHARPEIQARISEMKAQADREGAMAMAERRRLLAETARKASGKPTHGDRIAAIREDAILAGERRTDGTQVNIGGDVNIAFVIQSLKAATVPRGTLTEPQPVTEIAAGRPETVPTALRCESAMESGSNGPLAISGPLGRVKAAPAVLAGSGREMPVAAKSAPSVAYVDSE